MDQLSSIFSALADPTRRAIVARLCAGEATVGELCRPFDISAPAISRHLKVLEKANLIERRTDAQWRRCTLNEQGLKVAADWLETQREFWLGSFKRLEDVLNEEEPSRGKTQEGGNS